MVSDLSSLRHRQWVYITVELIDNLHPSQSTLLLDTLPNGSPMANPVSSPNDPPFT
jgi:hypothetical protein